MKKPTYIYALADPKTGDVRYIGKSVNPVGRFRIHLNDATSTQKGEWIRQLRDSGLCPLFYLLEGPCVDWEEAERRWIASYLTEGADLTNGNAGGAGVSQHSLETLKKMSESHKKAHATKGGHSQETRNKIGAANAKALLGHKQPAETVAKRKVTMAKKWDDPEFRAAHLAGLRDPVVLEKIAAANRARPVLTCDVCGQKIRGGPQNLTVHKQWKHSANPPTRPLLTCSICGKEVRGAAGLGLHKRSHSANPSPPKKRQSIRVSSTVIFTCDICGAQIKGPSAMATHKAFHAAVSTACGVCGQEVKGKGAMTTHMLWKHPDYSASS